MRFPFFFYAPKVSGRSVIYTFNAWCTMLCEQQWRAWPLKKHMNMLRGYSHLTLAAKKNPFFFVCYNLTCHSKAEEDLKYPTLKFMHYENEKKKGNKRKNGESEEIVSTRNKNQKPERKKHIIVIELTFCSTLMKICLFFFCWAKRKSLVLFYFSLLSNGPQTRMEWRWRQPWIVYLFIHYTKTWCFCFSEYFFFLALLFCAKQCMWREYLQTFLRNIWIGNPVRVVSHSNPWHTFILLWVLFPPPGLWAFSILFPL